MNRFIKNIGLKKVSLLVFTVIVVMLVSFFVLKGKSSTDEIGRDNTLPKIEFPEYGGDLPEVTYEDNIDYKKIENEEVLNQYYQIERGKNQKNIDSVKKAFNLDKVKSASDGDCEVIKGDDSEMRVYEDGAISYYDFTRGTDEIKIDDANCINIAQEFLKENDIVNSDYECRGVGYDVVETLDGSGKKEIVSKTVYYERSVDNVDINGNSPMFMTIDSEGEIVELYMASGEIGDKISYEAEVTVEEAVEKAMNYEGMIDVPDEYDSVTLEKVEVIYWEDSAIGTTNDTLQPIYKISGKAYMDNVEVGEFIAYETALN